MVAGSSKDTAHVCGATGRSGQFQGAWGGTPDCQRDTQAQWSCLWGSVQSQFQKTLHPCPCPIFHIVPMNSHGPGVRGHPTPFPEVER